MNRFADDFCFEPDEPLMREIDGGLVDADLPLPAGLWMSRTVPEQYNEDDGGGWLEPEYIETWSVTQKPRTPTCMHNRARVASAHQRGRTRRVTRRTRSASRGSPGGDEGPRPSGRAYAYTGRAS